MSDKHLSTQFDSELGRVSSRVMEMGGLVEAQVQQAVTALTRYSAEIAHFVIAREQTVNQFEVEIDHDISSIIARRQPTARDLRLLMAISKAVANLERAGDEAEKMARMATAIIENRGPRELPVADLRMGAQLAAGLLRKALDAFARLDTAAALAILREDEQIDREFGNFVRVLITRMMEDPRMVSSGLDLLFLAKAIERIGDHAKNIAELVIYILKGADVRHQSIEEIETVLK